MSNCNNQISGIILDPPCANKEPQKDKILFEIRYKTRKDLIFYYNTLFHGQRNTKIPAMLKEQNNTGKNTLVSVYYFIIILFKTGSRFSKT